MQESDWKAFRKLIPELRERYLAARNREIAALLAAPGKTETERFWKAEEEIRRQESILRDCLDDTRRSRLFEILSMMRRYGMLSDTDLEHFSTEMQEHLRALH